MTKFNKLTCVMWYKQIQLKPRQIKGNKLRHLYSCLLLFEFILKKIQSQFCHKCWPFEPWHRVSADLYIQKTLTLHLCVQNVQTKAPHPQTHSCLFIQHLKSLLRNKYNKTVKVMKLIAKEMAEDYLRLCGD